MYENIGIETPRTVRFKLLTVLGFIFLFFFGGGIKVKANSLYQTNFNQAGDWQVYPGSSANHWKNENGVLKASGGKGSKAILKNHQFTNFEYNASVVINRTGKVKNKNAKKSQSGLVFRVKNSAAKKNGYQGYYFGLDPAKQEVKLTKTNKSGKTTQIATKKMTVKYGKAYQLRVRVSGNHIQGYVDYNQDNYPRIDVVDSQFTGSAIGLSNSNGQASFDNVSVSTYADRSSNRPTYQNPILKRVADPDILFHNRTYYLYSTTPASQIGGIKVYTSTDLTHWTDKGRVMKKGKYNWGKKDFWAPDLIERNGKFYMYYVANEHINMSVSDSPLGPFKQKKFGPMHHTKEIDAHAFRDSNGQYYLYFVRIKNRNVIWGAKLNKNMRTIDEKSKTKLLAPSQSWEKYKKLKARVNEDPIMLKRNGTYYLTYSGSHFLSPEYGSGYATSKNPLGPYHKYKNNPILQTNNIVHGAGGHAITTSPDGKEMFIVYHRHKNSHKAEPRKFAIDRLRFTKDENGKTVLEVHGPTVNKQPIPSGASNVTNLLQTAKLSKKEITIPQGTRPKASQLPATVGIKTSKSQPGQDPTALIHWDLGEYDPHKISPQTIHGSLALPSGVKDLGHQNLKVIIQIKTSKRH